MIDKIKSIVREFSDEAIIKNPAVPNDKNEQAIDTTANSLVDHIKAEAHSGNANSLIDILQKDDDPVLNPSVSRVSTGVASDLVKKLGIDNGAAQGIVNKIIPPIINKIRAKTNNPNDNDFDLHTMLSSFGKGGGMLDSVKNIFGKR
ncbi:MAG TPA: hypothetical protein VK172_09460 [Lentimicrobium sp.]|nr:hypothetical protein [Lentimicrobium sp.]